MNTFFLDNAGNSYINEISRKDMMSQTRCDVSIVLSGGRPKKAKKDEMHEDEY